MKYLSVCVIFIALGSCTSTSTLTMKSSRVPAQEYPNYNSGLAKIANGQTMTFSILKNLLITGKYSTIEELLPQLNQSYPDYLKFHTLMYSSLSLHGSSYAEPRAIVFGPEARFIFTFNGGPHQQGGNALETVEFSSDTHSFQFREISFKSQISSTMELTRAETDYEDERIVISKANPQKCLQCHGQNASPIWGTYFLWPGSYGGNDDQLFMSVDRSSWNANNSDYFASATRPQSLGRQFDVPPGTADSEVDGYIRYLQRKPSHSRYKWLPTRVADQAFLRFAQGEPYKDIDVSIEAEREQKKFKAYYAWPSRPNLYLLEALGRLNNDRITFELDRMGLRAAFSNPVWEQFRKQRLLLKDADLEGASALILKTIQAFKLQRSPPSLETVKHRLIQNLKDEIQFQRQRIEQFKDQFGKITFLPGDLGNSRLEFEWIPNTESFYKKLLNLKTVSEVDRAAFHMESDDQVLMTLIDLLLNDRGFNLRQVNMNIRQESVTFNDSGFSETMEFLGIPSSN